MPGLDNVVGVVDGVHLDHELGHDVDDGCEVEEPAEEVDEAGEEAHAASMAGTGGDGCPVVDSACGWDGGGELGQRCANEGVVEAGDEQLVQHTRWSSIVDGDGQ